MVFEVKCTGEGHPEFFRDQSYALKVLYNYGVGTNEVPKFYENEYQVCSTLDPHPNINQYFCHFADRLPTEYFTNLPPVAKELAFDKKGRMRAFLCVVLAHHSETLGRFLKSLKTVNPFENTTPWCIVHKYSRDICAGLTHLFVNQIIHFAVKLDNIVLSHNQEHAILIDLGCAIRFVGSFECEPRCLVGVAGNPSHRAPEILNAAHITSILSCAKQPSFELGCILFELSMGGQHPLPGYPLKYSSHGYTSFSFDSEELFPMKPPAFPREFCHLVWSLLQFDPQKRMPLLDASKFLSSLTEPSPLELLSFYTHTFPLRHDDAGTLTLQSVCQILCDYSRESCLCCFFILLRIALVKQKNVAIDEQHRTTLPELILSVLWTSQVSCEFSGIYNNRIQLLLDKATSSRTVTGQQQTPSTSLSSIFLRKVTSSYLVDNMYKQMWSEHNTKDIQKPRNNCILKALFYLEMGNIDYSLRLVSEAHSLFEFDHNHDEKPSCFYLPALLYLHCACCISDNQAELRKHIPDNLTLAFSRAISSSLQSLRDYCQAVLLSHKAAEKEVGDTSRIVGVTEEWTELFTTLTNPRSEQSKWPWAYIHFGALWATCCLELNASYPTAWIELSLKPPTSSLLDSASVLSKMQPRHWWSSSLYHLGSCYLWGIGVYRDTSKAKTLFQRASDAGNARAKINLGMCFQTGTGTVVDINKAVPLFKMAAEAGEAMALFNIGWCYCYGYGVSRDIKKAVELYQRASEAGVSRAIFNLALLYECGCTGELASDTNKALSLYKRAADSGDNSALQRLENFHPRHIVVAAKMCQPTPLPLTCTADYPPKSGGLEFILATSTSTYNSLQTHEEPDGTLHIHVCSKEYRTNVRDGCLSPLRSTGYNSVYKVTHNDKIFKHRNLVELLEVGWNSESICLITEYCAGGDLHHFIHVNPYIEEDTAAEIIFQLVSGLAFLHSCNIFHRDMKPANVLLTEDYQTVKIADFEMSKILQPNWFETLCGRPCYMAPEVCGEHYDSKADMWALGVITYNLLYGTEPFEGKTVEDINKNVQEFKIKRPPMGVRSAAATAFTLSLLAPYEERPDAKLALNHPWLSKAKTKLRMLYEPKATSYFPDLLTCCGLLGTGGNSVVFQVTSKNIPGKKLALKATPMFLEESAVMNTKIGHEAHILSLVGYHPNIIHLLSSGYGSLGQDFLDCIPATREWFEEAFKRSSPIYLSLYEKCDFTLGCVLPPVLTPGVAIWSLRQCCQALRHLEYQFIAHRDIKLANIMFNMADNSVRLIDFGCATEVGRSWKVFVDVVGDQPWGNPHSLPPEICQAVQARTSTTSSILIDYSKCDLYAVAIAFYDLLGTNPAMEYQSSAARPPLQPEFSFLSGVLGRMSLPAKDQRLSVDDALRELGSLL
ncbi:serine/threonine-protein kinase ATG1t [Pelomyxa schiedti]|nr:serine/threonine-protein kinase ATG1t [Pelomyxa schiedti]